MHSLNSALRLCATYEVRQAEKQQLVSTFGFLERRFTTKLRHNVNRVDVAFCTFLGSFTFKSSSIFSRLSFLLSNMNPKTNNCEQIKESTLKEGQNHALRLDLPRNKKK